MRQNSASPQRLTILGSFHDGASKDWPTFKILHGDGSVAPSTERRLESPDLKRHPSDESAARNRFEITSECAQDCTLEVTRPSKPNVRLRLNGSGKLTASWGSGRLNLDSVVYGFGPLKRFAVSLRAWLIKLYGMLAPLLVLAGLMALITTLIRSVKTRTVEPLFVVATGAWVLVATRIFILAMIDISAFPASNYLYSAPANYLVLIAAMLTIASCKSELSQVTLRAQEAVRRSRQNAASGRTPD